MRNILALVGAATVTFLGLGWYLGWYKIDRNAPVGTQGVHVEINPDKISSDVKKGVVRGTEIVEDIRNGSGNSADAKPATLTTPQGPASNFFGPGSKENTGKGQTSFAPPAVNKPKPNDDDSLFGIRLPGK